VMAAIEPLLRPGETVRQCSACGRAFVSDGDARYCTQAPCQIRARQREDR